MDIPKYIEFDGQIWRLGGEYYKRVITITLHRYVWEKHNGLIPEGYHIHHIDGNKLNNDISNLECLSQSEHHKRHWETDYDKMHKITSENVVKYKRTDEHKKRLSEWSKEYWKYKQLSKIKCNECGKYFSTKQPELAKQCRRCQKDTHYKEKQDERICKICDSKFTCYSYSKTFTCSQSCAVKHAWKTKRGEI